MGNNCISPLRRAIRSSDVAMVEEILKEAGEGAPDLINEDYTADCFFDCKRNTQNPLQTACSRGLVDIIEVLLKYGADPNSTGLWRQTGLHRAGRANNLALAKLLISFGTDLYARDCDGRYAIHCAALSAPSRTMSNIDTIRYFYEEIGKPEDIQLKDYSGNTVLHASAYWNNIVSAEYLLAKGADITAKNEDGKTPLEVAKKETRTFLQEHVDKMNKG